MGIYKDTDFYSVTLAVKEERIDLLKKISDSFSEILDFHSFMHPHTIYLYGNLFFAFNTFIETNSKVYKPSEDMLQFYLGLSNDTAKKSIDNYLISKSHQNRLIYPTELIKDRFSTLFNMVHTCYINIGINYDDPQNRLYQGLLGLRNMNEKSKQRILKLFPECYKNIEF